MNVDFDAAPPIYIPLGFFLIASIAAITASLIPLMDITFGLTSGLNRAAFIHLFTIGFFMITMIGALFQVLPIVLGVNVIKQRIIASLSISGLLLGSFSLFFTLRVAIEYLPLSVSMTLTVLIIFVCAAVLPILKTQHWSNSKIAILLALLSLIVAVIFGFLNGQKFFITILNDLTLIKELHLMWALLGWIPLLIIGVSYQVIPMFHVCPNYNDTISKILPIILFITLLISSLFSFFGGAALYSIIFSIYLALTVNLLSKRKRKVFDPTVRFWFLAICCAISAIAIFWCAYIFSNTQLFQASIILLLFGFSGSVIIGMQHKIIPFLVFMHLQRASFNPPYPVFDIPPMNQILSKTFGKIHFYLHIAWICTLMFAFFEGGFIVLACAVGVINFGMLTYCICKGLLTYKTILKNV